MRYIYNIYEYATYNNYSAKKKEEIELFRNILISH